jgi:hypothetical protein
MAVVQIDTINTLAPEKFLGLSTDAKPNASSVKPGATFWETDTKIGYIFATAWVQV